MTISINPNTGGYYTFFNHRGQRYYADISDTTDCGPECMIFTCDAQGQVTNWTEVFGRRLNTITKELLIECIKDFKNGAEW